MPRIVVGVDGSPESKRALAWAIEEARLRDADLAVVYAYGPPEDYNPYALSYAAATVRAAETIAEDERRWREHRHTLARERAESVLAGVLRDVPAEGVRVEQAPVEDARPPRALIAHAQDADLLVVGSRGRGGFAGLVLGSVSQQVTQHAPCPVVIVR